MAAGETFSGPFIVSVRRASGENRQGNARRATDVAGGHAGASQRT